jgi:pilus assembly protein CpaF
MREELLQLVLKHDELAELDPAERRLALRDLLVREGGEADVSHSLAELANTIDGFGPLTPLMEDDSISDVLVNGVDEVWVERAGRVERTSVRFNDLDELMHLIDRLVSHAGARADVERPVADARLQDGSRIHVVLPPVAPSGPLISIRRFRKTAWRLDDLLAAGMMDNEQALTLAHAVHARKTIAISGGTGCGKTTLLNALLGEIDTGERVVLIEETQELRPSCLHHVELLARAPNIEGKGSIEMLELVRAALRMRPDRIVIGEVRGSEALAALAAMSVGHKGSMVTVHARSAGGVTDRFVSLALLAGSGLSETSLRRQVETAFDLFIHLDRAEDGRRVVIEIVES